jgi:hypothetical protein
MSASKIGVFASLALAAGAMLIPPTITAADLGDDKAMEGLVINPFKRSVVLECHDCAFFAEKDGAFWQQGTGNAFVSTKPEV